MIKPVTNPVLVKSKTQIFFEYICLALCLCVIALRTTFTEGLHAQSSNQPINFDSSIYSLSISALLIFAFVLWFVQAALGKKFLYRFTNIEIGLTIFCIAAIIASLFAPNKRAAITDFTILVAPIFMTILLVQILDSYSKIKLILIVIAAFGVVSVYQCIEQVFVSNQIMIEQYEQYPNSLLAPLNIRPGSFQQMLFEHRLYTKGVRGFFTNSNSAGSFALMASFAAIALFIGRFKNRKSELSSFMYFLSYGIGAAVVILGLFFTRSKGAIIAFLISTTMFAIYIFFGNWLKLHKKAIVIICILLIMFTGFAVVTYGLTHNLFPGGSSMLVRWQYWYASVQMYADHLLTGVGPGNFAYFYTNYKPAAALESVADPHNFLLSILTQFGPIGLVGFLTIIILPLWKVSKSTTTLSSKINQPKSAITFLVPILAALLFIRPFVMPITHVNSVAIIIYLIFTLYVAPAIVFMVGFVLLSSGSKATGTATENITMAALFCAIIGVLIHNIIDFAIFEPGVFTIFCTMLACLIALDFHRKERKPIVVKPAFFAKTIIAAAGLLIIWAYLSYVLIPVAKTTSKIKQAYNANLNGLPGFAADLLAQATESDPSCPAAPSRNARLHLSLFRNTGRRDSLVAAEKYMLIAIERNKADFKSFEQLAEVYSLFSRICSPEQRSDYLNKAFANAFHTVELYPGSGRLRIKLAQFAEQLGKTDIAITNYEKAIDIENSYREQFRIMYPGQTIFSRLGEEKYQTAKQRIKLLSKSLTP